MHAKAGIWVWSAVFIAGVIASAYFVTGTVEDGEEHAHDSPTELLLPMRMDDIAAVEIVVRGDAHRYERNDDGAWYKHAHTHDAVVSKDAHRHKVPADVSARIAKALTTFSRTRVERVIAKLPLQQDNYGTAEPEIVIAIFVIGEVRPALSLRVGHQTPDGFARYVAVVQRGVVVAIPEFQIARLREFTSLRPTAGNRVGQ